MVLYNITFYVQWVRICSSVNGGKINELMCNKYCHDFFPELKVTILNLDPSRTNKVNLITNEYAHFYYWYICGINCNAPLLKSQYQVGPPVGSRERVERIKLT